MLILLSLIPALAQQAAADQGCVPIGLSDLVQVEAPAVIVLGESQGETDDLRRAAQVVRALRDRDRVTLALQAVHEDETRNLDALSAAVPNLDKVAEAVGWQEHWPWPTEGYRPLLALGLADSPGGVDLIAIGPNDAPDADARIPVVPTGYPERLGVLSGDTLSPTMRTRLAQARTWGDSRMAERALGAWDGKGYLVVVADRTRVAGRGGVDWQLRQRTDSPVVAAILDWSDQDCVDGTWLWSAPTLRASLPSWVAPSPNPEKAKPSN
ncbi:MAG: ChaN family lipoprotein [Myxococcota bacterium]